MKKKISLIVGLLVTSLTLARASEIGTTAGLTLLKPGGARAAALGEAFTAVTNDITAFHYNPASLKSLQSGQASFVYEKGSVSDSWGDVAVGLPSQIGTWGLSIGYFNAGDIKLVDESLVETQVNAEKDITAALGYANQVGLLRWGVAGKYISSKLIDQYSAHAFAADLGAQLSLGERWAFGAAAQNLGTKMKYQSEGYDLPRIYRAGTSVLLIPGKHATSLLVDFPYYSGDKEMRPAIGLEVAVGPLALRTGFQKTSGVNKEITAGAGFQLANWSVDYSFGMVDKLSDQHRLSLSVRFGAGAPPAPEFYSPPAPTTKEQPSMVPAPVEPRFAEPEPVTPPRPSRRYSPPKLKKPLPRRTLGNLNRVRSVHGTYTVRPGDTLGKIARRFYGDARQWKRIYEANRHLLRDTRDLKVGTRIVLP